MSWNKHKLGQKIGLMVAALAFVSGLQTGTANAVGSGYVASDVLGQLDGSGNPTFTTSAFGLGAAQLYYPTGSAVDTVHHRLFVGQDGPNYRVTVYNLDTNNNLIDHTADYIIGQPDFATDNSGVTQNGGSSQYEGVLYDGAANRLFVSDVFNGRVLVYDLSGGITNGMNASYVLGQPDFTTEAMNTTQNGMKFTGGLAFDSTNKRLFIGDYSNNRVLVYDLSGGITNGMNASYVLGQPDFTSATANTTQNGLSSPQDVAYNPNTKQLFVADTNNKRVLVYDFSAGITNGMNASYVLGQTDFISSVTAVSQSRLGTSVQGIGLDAVRNVLYISDSSSSRIMVYNLSGGITNGMNATMVLGQPDFTSSASATTQTGLNRPDGNIGVDPTNNRIYVSDASNNRVIIYDFAHIRNSTGGSAAVAGVNSVSATPGTTFYLKLTAAGVQGTATFALTGGALPPGLVLNGATGEITGTPTKPGSYTFEITTYDNLGAIGTYVEDPTYTITVAGSAPGAPDTGTRASSIAPLALVAMLMGILGTALMVRKNSKP